jgi:ATP-dependent protease HslVU (ClpYQ) peptidase subunit
MTTIAGLEHQGKIYMAADSLICSGQMMQELQDEKVFQRGDILFGVTGSAVLIAAVRYQFNIPKPLPAQPIREYLATTFITDLRYCLESAKCIDPDNANYFPGTILIGYCGKLYKIDESYALFAITDPYTATGSGRDYALATLEALATITPPIVPPEIIVRRAIEVAIKYDIYSSGAVHVSVLE